MPGRKERGAVIRPKKNGGSKKPTLKTIYGTGSVLGKLLVMVVSLLGRKGFKGKLQTGKGPRGHGVLLG